MRENLLKARWAEGRATVNGWLAIPSAFAAEVMAHQGWDSLTVDMQHGIVDYQAMVTMLQAISTTATVPLVRVPWREPGIIMKSLDAGAYGVICPMINTREECEELVAACRYPPRGNRSFGPIRALLYAGADYPRHANDHVLAIAMIETRQAVESLEEILAVPGLDGIYVGPADLSNSMGFTPTFDQEEPAVVEAIGHIVRTARRHGVRAGIHCGAPSYAKRMMALGFDFTTLLSDARLMAMKAQEILSAMQDRPAVGGTAGAY
jgi:4-hydroxy-2-oxoheptanedioate aldolase